MAIYDINISAFNLKKIVNIMFLIYLMLIVSFPEAVCKNRYFQKPTQSEFQAQMRETLRVAKERYRSRMRGPRARRVEATRINRDLWSDERTEEEDDHEETMNDE